MQIVNLTSLIKHIRRSFPEHSRARASNLVDIPSDIKKAIRRKPRPGYLVEPSQSINPELIKIVHDTTNRKVPTSMLLDESNILFCFSSIVINRRMQQVKIIKMQGLFQQLTLSKVQSAACNSKNTFTSCNQLDSCSSKLKS